MKMHEGAPCTEDLDWQIVALGITYRISTSKTSWIAVDSAASGLRFWYLPTNPQGPVYLGNSCSKTHGPWTCLTNLATGKNQCHAPLGCAICIQPRPSFTQRRLHQLRAYPHPPHPHRFSTPPSTPACVWEVSAALVPLWACWTSSVSSWSFKRCGYMCHVHPSEWEDDPKIPQVIFMCFTGVHYWIWLVHLIRSHMLIYGWIMLNIPV